MFVHGRKTGEKIAIGEDINVVVVDIRGSRVRLGFETPRHVQVLRDELQPPADDRESPGDASQNAM